MAPRPTVFLSSPLSFRVLALIVMIGLLLSLVRTSHASVNFENTGTLSGWSHHGAQHSGSNTQVSSPTYKGSTAIRSRQIYEGSGSGNYHAETVKDNAQSNGSDRYYGQAIQFPSSWAFHGQNVTFQQWAPDNNAGPWILMFIEGSKLRYAKVRGTGTGIHDIMDISGMRGQWIRVVTRIKMTTSGIFEVWINGSKKVSASGDWSTGWASNSSIRWSSGIYCTRWDTEAPAGQSDLSIYHDHFRIATSYNEAEPANWPAGTQPTATRTRTNTPGGPTATRTRTRTRTPTTSGSASAWAPNKAYAVGATVTYGGATYRCTQAHTSQVGWEPPNVPALWQRL